MYLAPILHVTLFAGRAAGSGVCARASEPECVAAMLANMGSDDAWTSERVIKEFEDVFTSSVCATPRDWNAGVLSIESLMREFKTTCIDSVDTDPDVVPPIEAPLDEFVWLASLGQLEQTRLVEEYRDHASKGGSQRMQIRNDVNAYLAKNTCKYCNASYTGRSGLYSHITKTHPEERKTFSKNFECTVCKKRFSQNNTLRRHLVRVHRYAKSTIRAYECEVCGEVFSHPSILRCHRRSRHPGCEKEACVYEYKCRVCKDVFKHQLDLHRHKKTRHPQEMPPAEPNECSVCGKKYLHQSVLGNHMREKHPDTPFVEKNTHLQKPRNYKCRFCSAQYRSYSGVFRHVRASHPERIVMVQKHGCVDAEKNAA